MADVRCIVKQKFGPYNVGEKITESDRQVRQWEKFDLVQRLPDPPEIEARAMQEPPQHKMVTVADEAKSSDDPNDTPQRRGPGRPASR